MGVNLYDYQKDALSKLNNGSILCGGVGSGKSRTGIAYYFTQNGGSVGKDYEPMTDPAPDLYIITTARKRDTGEWDGDLAPFLLSTHEELNMYSNKVVVDSWNNIGKYIDITNAFFLFDEQRVVGNGAWVKAFLKITKNNKWILLSATPGDTWQDYIPVFLANGFYKNRTEFIREHVVYSNRYSSFPKIDRYLNTGRLIRLRNSILVNMDYKRPTTCHDIDIWVDYNQSEYKWLMKNRFNKDTDEPIQNASELCYQLRKIVNSDSSRLIEVADIVQKRHKVIVFYNFDYELDILKSIPYVTDCGEICDVAEWNGHKHQPIPKTNNWVYLVQYNAGAEGWNCVMTDTIIFYSQNYSYKIMVQSSGRIDRLNTPFNDLYYYHLKSKSNIDLAISKALKSKKKFNETKFASL